MFKSQLFFCFLKKERKLFDLIFVLSGSYVRMYTYRFFQILKYVRTVLINTLSNYGWWMKKIKKWIQTNTMINRTNVRRKEITTYNTPERNCTKPMNVRTGTVTVSTKSKDDRNIFQTSKARNINSST